ncbi:MAG: hypothetical protein RL394_689, partial [Bacteroidota bacterium]
MRNMCKSTKGFLLILFCCSLTVVAKGQKLKKFIADKKEYILGKFEDSSGKANFLMYPTLAYTPETRTEIGLVNLFLFYANNNTKNRL